MKRAQQGMTLMSMVMVLCVLGFFALVTMKLFPMYSEYNNLRGVMDEFANQPGSAEMTQTQVFNDLSRRFNIAYVESVQKENITLIREGSRVQLKIEYERRTPLFGNLDAVGHFSKTVTLGGSGPGG